PEEGAPQQREPFAGTPAYAAPEQFAGHPVPQSDVWGLGATLYEALALRPPFDGRTFSEILNELLNPALPVGVRQRIDGVPRDLDASCRKALRRDPAARYQSAAELAGDLRRWLRHEPTTVGATWLGLRRPWLWARRNPGWAAALLAVVIGINAATLWRAH